VKNSTLQSTIKTLEPLEQNVKNKSKGPTFKVFRKSCTKGFEVVNLETLKMQGLLHPEDTSHEFVLKKENVKPIAIYRVGRGDFYYVIM
ncbi:19420_t:CDS:2, partial [Racocetra persica]